jgi:cysteine synthase
VDSHDNLYILENAGGRRIRRVDATTRIISTYLQDLALQVGFAFDASDNLYYGTGTQIVRIDGQTKARMVIAGTGTAGYSEGGGDALQAMFVSAEFLTIDRTGAVVVADNGNFRIRKISLPSPPALSPSLRGGGGTATDSVPPPMPRIGNGSATPGIVAPAPPPR